MPQQSTTLEQGLDALKKRAIQVAQVFSQRTGAQIRIRDWSQQGAECCLAVDLNGDELVLRVAASTARLVGEATCLVPGDADAALRIGRVTGRSITGPLFSALKERGFNLNDPNPQPVV